MQASCRWNGVTDVKQDWDTESVMIYISLQKIQILKVTTLKLIRCAISFQCTVNVIMHYEFLQQSLFSCIAGNKWFHQHFDHEVEKMRTVTEAWLNAFRKSSQCGSLAAT